MSATHLKRFNHKEVHVVKIDGKFIFQCRDCILKQPGSNLTPKQKYVVQKRKQAGSGSLPDKDDTCEDDIVDSTSQADGDVEQDTWSMTPDLPIRETS